MPQLGVLSEPKVPLGSTALQTWVSSATGALLMASSIPAYRHRSTDASQDIKVATSSATTVPSGSCIGPKDGSAWFAGWL